jgi:hypothetical protein
MLLIASQFFGMMATELNERASISPAETATSGSPNWQEEDFFQENSIEQISRLPTMGLQSRCRLAAAMGQ